MTTASLFTNQGIAALKAGDKAEARRWLGLAVKRNPNDYTAWLWLSGAVGNDQERLECLQQVLRIVPENSAAAAGIAQMEDGHKGDAASSQGGLPVVPPFEDPDSLQHQPPKPASLQAPPLKFDQLTTQENSERDIFRIRPSLLPAILSSALIVLVLAVIYWLILSFAADSDVAKLVFAAIIGLSLLMLFLLSAQALLRFLFVRYTLTTHKLTLRMGIFSQNTTTIPVKKIRKVSRTKNILTRILSIGDITVYLSSATSSDEDIQLRSVRSCRERTRQILRVAGHRH
jgi:membrane protein YdbS with pleckstrin-like domain